MELKQQQCYCYSLLFPIRPQEPVSHPIFIILSKYTSDHGLSVLQSKNFYGHLATARASDSCLMLDYVRVINVLFSSYYYY